jgi:tRNA modification GTPase
MIESVGDLRHIFAVNKVDKLPRDQRTRVLRHFRERLPAGTTVVDLSAITGDGLDSLRQAILAPFISEDGEDAGFLVTDARHFDLLCRAAEEISRSVQLLEQHTSEEIVLIGLHNALRYLGQITGETTTEDMLTRIFSTFCIGK